MGSAVNECRESEGESFPHLLRVRYDVDRGVAGTVFGANTLRFVMLDGFRFELGPEGYLLIYNSIDRPGMLAKAGSVLSHHDANIAGVSLGRTEIGQNTLTVMNIDADIPGVGMKGLLGLEGATNLRLVRLDFGFSFYLFFIK